MWVPTEQDYNRVLSEQNPWHGTDSVPEAWAKSVERPLVRFILNRLNPSPSSPRRFQLLLGPRRVGKTTAMYQTVRRLLRSGIPARRLLWLRLDHPLLMSYRLDQLVRNALAASGATPKEPLILFLDELVYAQDWDLWLKTFYDEAWPVCILGSSSSTAALQQRRMESGIGRWEEQYLAPCLFTEFLELCGEQSRPPVGETLCETLEACIAAHLPISDEILQLRRRLLFTGGFPELLMTGQLRATDEVSNILESQRILRSDAVERAIYKDIPQAFGVDNPMLLERLLYTLAGQMCGLLSPRTLSQSLDGLAQTTFDRYLAYLERAFLVFTLPNYSGSEAQVQKRGRKLYFIDGAVRNAALQRGVAPLQDAVETGLLLENLAVGHLHALAAQSQVRLYHWRHNNDEVDAIYDHPQQPLAFEIASSASHHKRGMREFLSRYPRFKGRGYLVAPGLPARRAKDTQDGVGTVGLDTFLIAVGAQAERELEGRIGGWAAVSH